jgi:hypothetical protein
MSQLTKEQARVAARALAPRVIELEELLNRQAQQMLPGNGSWAITAERLDLHRGALLALQNIGAGQ